MRADGKIDYCEFSGSDIPATKRFYAHAFGWRFTDYGPTYAGLRRREGSMAAYPASRAPLKQTAIVVLYATDIEAMSAKVKVAGGAITKDIFSFPGGRRFSSAIPPGTNWQSGRRPDLRTRATVREAMPRITGPGRSWVGVGSLTCDCKPSNEAWPDRTGVAGSPAGLLPRW